MRSLYRTSVFVIMSMSSLVLPGTAAAQSIAEPNTITVTPFTGAAFGTSEGLGGSLIVGAALEYDLTTTIGIEGDIGHVFDVLGNNANEDWSITNVSANAVFNFPAPRITPYATFGIGVERSNPTVKNVDPKVVYPVSSTEVSYSIGGGVKYPLSERFLARADLRRFQAVDVAPDYWRLYGGITWWIKR